MTKLFYSTAGKFENDFVAIPGNVPVSVLLEVFRIKYALLGIEILSLTCDPSETPATIRLVLASGPPKAPATAQIAQAAEALMKLSKSPTAPNLCEDCKADHEWAELFAHILDPSTAIPYLPPVHVLMDVPKGLLFGTFSAN